MLTTDGELTWAPDPELTGLGAQQAHDVRKAWQDHLGAPDQAERPPLPAAFFASPLARSANTLRLSYEGIAWPTSAEGAGEAAAAQAAAEAASPSRPFILESLRENFADRHTCDQRSRRSDVAKRWEALGWSVDTAMPQDDELFAVRVGVQSGRRCAVRPKWGGGDTRTLAHTFTHPSSPPCCVSTVVPSLTTSRAKTT